jgi:HAD superfamily hydrolase (TIGR01459 family)
VFFFKPQCEIGVCLSGKAELLKSPPNIIHAAGLLLADYDVLFCDVWGVVHNGHVAFDDACRALAKFRNQGGTVILVSNAPVPAFRVAAMLEARHVPQDAWDEIISSGALALTYVKDQGYQRAHGIGPRDRDAAFFKHLSSKLTPLEDAQVIVCTGLTNDSAETPDDYRPLLEQALDRKLPFVCANPDLVVDVGGTHYWCAGAIAELYAKMGGDVYWAGKPHRSAYEAAKRSAEILRGSAVDVKRCLVIGDALRTDMEGARRMGVDALFVASGIHKNDVMDGDSICKQKLSALFGPDAPPALAAMTELKW